MIRPLAVKCKYETLSADVFLRNCEEDYELFNVVP